MIVKVEIAAELHDKLKLKSAKTGISQLELVNRYVSEGLRFDEKREVESPKPMTPEEIDALLEHDWPGATSLGSPTLCIISEELKL